MKHVTVLGLLALALAVLAGCTNYGEELTFKKGTVYYKDGVTKDEAQKVGELFVEIDYFDDDTERDVQVLKDGGTFVVKIVVDKSRITDEAEVSFRAIGGAISEKLGGADVRMVLVDTSMDEIKTL